MREDRALWPVLTALADCLTSELELAETPEVTHLGVLAGGEVPFDVCADGGAQAWVRLATAFPSIEFPEVDGSTNSCTGLLAAQVEIGIARCVPVPKVVGRTLALPTLEEQLERSRLLLADMNTMRRAVRCCMSRRDAVLGQYAPFGPAGGVIGGVWTITVSEEF